MLEGQENKPSDEKRKILPKWAGEKEVVGKQLILLPHEATKPSPDSVSLLPTLA